jgi:hypothetical protein
VTTVMIIGNNAAAVVAAYAASFRQAGVGLIVPMDGDETTLSTSWEDALVPALLPMNVLLAHEVQVRTTGTEREWAMKVGRPEKLPEAFIEQELTVYREADIFATLAPFASTIGQGWPRKEVSLSDLLAAQRPDVLISTLPRESFCTQLDFHGFTRERIWCSNVFGTASPGQIWLNGEATPAFYYSHNVGGNKITRWRGVKPPITDLHEVSLPVATNCDCAPEGMLHVGREATYDPTKTLVDVFSETVRAIMAAEEAGDDQQG